MKKSVAIIYITYDGAVNSASGVGVLSRYFVDAMPLVADKVDSANDIETSLHIIAVKLSSAADGYDSNIREHTNFVCSSLNGILHLIDNGLRGEKGYGGLNNWKLAAKNAAAVILDLAPGYDHVIAYLVDTPFMCTPDYFYDVASADNVTFVVVPHSDTYTHFPDAIDQERLSWETSGIQAVNGPEPVYLAMTSKFMLRTLQEHYEVPSDRIIPMQTGLVLSSPRFMPLSQNEIATKLVDYGIPSDKTLIFRVGRAVPYKGFSDLILSFAKLLQHKPDAYLVFVAPPHKNEVGITADLDQLIRKLGIQDNCTAIYTLDMDLPRYLCQWKNTKIVAELSHREPFGMVPEEVRIWASEQGPVIVASDLDGFVEQIDSGADGFLVNPNDHEAVADVFLDIINSSDEEIADIRQAGAIRAKSEYDYVSAVEQSYLAVLSARGVI